MRIEFTAVFNVPSPIRQLCLSNDVDSKQIEVFKQARVSELNELNLNIDNIEQTSGFFNFHKKLGVSFIIDDVDALLLISILTSRTDVIIERISNHKPPLDFKVIFTLT